MPKLVLVLLIRLVLVGSFLPVANVLHHILESSSSRVKRHSYFFSLFEQKQIKLGGQGGDSFANEQDRVTAARNTSVQQQAQWQALTRAALKCSDSLMTLRLVGITELPTTSTQGNQQCLVLASAAATETLERSETAEPQPCLLVPLIRDGYLKPIEAAVAGLPLRSEPILLHLNSNLVNRDGGLWDNLPWSSWTIDIDQRNRDASGNSIDPKFHLGKRDAYNVMLGKDWFTYQSSSRAVSFLAEQLRSVVDKRESNPPTTKDGNDKQDNDAEQKNLDALAQRLLEFQIRDVEMEIAELEYQMAIARVENPDQVASLEFQKEEIFVGFNALKEQFDELTASGKLEEQGHDGSAISATSSPSDLMKRILDLVDKRKEAPYRGATGYAPYQSGSDDTLSLEQFTSSYDMLVNIIENQLKADVIGCVLENTSLLEGTIVIGGAVVLRRRTAQKQVSIMGQTYSVEDEDEDYGNKGLKGGETFVVECEADEALGISLACPNLPLQINTALWELSAIMAERSKTNDNTIKSLSDALDTWKVLNSELSVLLEGQARNESATERVAPIRLPRTSTSLYDAMIRQLSQSTSSNNKNAELFPADNPVRSIAQFDSMTDQDKARTLMSLSNFQGRLPRPRTVRQAKEDAKTNPLDELLLPRIDESVRRQYLIRDAKQRGDTDLVRELEQAKSLRQKALEAANRARSLGQDEVADQWENEADLYGSLRADLTQDEGSYSRFLDRDEWYERERRKTASRIDKKKFGTLLDGIE
ncbi:hypothetical protein ACA910_014539 [Epithemia clementina (nom. ined.)]